MFVDGSETDDTSGTRSSRGTAAISLHEVVRKLTCRLTPTNDFEQKVKKAWIGLRDQNGLQEHCYGIDRSER